MVSTGTIPAEAEFAMSVRLGEESDKNGATRADIIGAAYGATSRTERYAEHLAAIFLADGLEDGTIIERRGRYFLASAN